MNNIGSYSCECQAGFNGDGITCDDIDECIVGSHQCSFHATCSNTEGSYTCSCNTGYTGDGLRCYMRMSKRIKRFYERPGEVHDIYMCKRSVYGCPCIPDCGPNAYCSRARECRCHTGFTGKEELALDHPHHHHHHQDHRLHHHHRDHRLHRHLHVLRVSLLME